MGYAVIQVFDRSLAMDYHSDQSRGTAIPAIGYCAEKIRLMDAFLDAIHELGQLQSAQARALIEGDPDFSRFDALIHMANEKKDQVKYSWLAHVEQHHC
jgi:hypothetical protein